MKNAAAHAKKLTSVLKGLKKKIDLPGVDADPIEVLVKAVLAWESTTDKAEAMFSKLCAGTVDWNDLRVCMPEEIAAMAGDKSPEALERATRLKLSMRGVYLRHHEVTLEPERANRKREVKTFIERLEGMPASAAARLLSVCFDIPAIGVDSQACELLASKGAVPEDASEDEVSSWLSKQINPTQALEVQAKLQAWVDAEHTKLQAARKKDRQAAERAANKLRDQSAKDRAARQIARAKAMEEARKIAEEKARMREAKKVEAEARKARVAAEKDAKAAAKKAASVKKKAPKSKVSAKKTKKKVAARKSTAKKTTKKTTKKSSKKTSKKASKNKKASKKTSKKASKKTSKKASKKTVAKRKKTAKKTTKKVAKRISTKKKVAKRAATRKKTSRKR